MYLPAPPVLGRPLSSQGNCTAHSRYPLLAFNSSTVANGTDGVHLIFQDNQVVLSNDGKPSTVMIDPIPPAHQQGYLEALTSDDLEYIFFASQDDSSVRYVSWDAALPPSAVVQQWRDGAAFNNPPRTTVLLDNIWFASCKNTTTGVATMYAPELSRKLPGCEPVYLYWDQ
jgi:hypothetical protein